VVASLFYDHTLVECSDTVEFFQKLQIIDDATREK